ncbi:chromate transporter [Sphingopyxis sp. QXT-31]|uniref:chromate efflux transporter n=1 Tax=Sphingopyxis sp. QXT-31 TaxID=1357916 RepID=UPI00097922A5|nr:chromate efflux transporter [Sphingopyxis sp. QXT-31]AQA00158.1 chromate transporter [Sphingopyxis sp. QXT-31]
MTELSPPITPSFAEAVRAYARIGCLSFGGPAGQIALMHREFVDERRWVDEATFLHALNFCHLLPGPEAQQLATWIGWRLHGLRGGLAAGLLFIVPGALVMLGLSVLYVMAAGLDWFAALFLGIKAAVLAIVVQALLRIAGRALKTPLQRGIAVASFVAIAILTLPFPVVILGALLIGWAAGRWRPEWLKLAPVAMAPSAPARSAWRQSVSAVLGWGTIWAAPMLLILVTLGKEHVLWDIGVFFSQLAVVTFGGAYAVLAYMAQEAVSGFGWLRPGEMADGLGLAETTPGPLILVTQFVGFLAAYRDAAPFTPFVAALLGAGLTLWVTFAPCFLWIFAFAPWIDRLERAAGLKGALAAVTAAVVGVIANLSLWFALHVLFRRLAPSGWGFEVPVWASVDWAAVLLSVLAALLLFRFKLGILSMLAICSAAGLVLGLGFA